MTPHFQIGDQVRLTAHGLDQLARFKGAKTTGVITRVTGHGSFIYVRKDGQHQMATAVIETAILELLPCQPEYARKVSLAILARLAWNNPPMLIETVQSEPQYCPICRLRNQEPERSLCAACISKGFDR